MLHTLLLALALPLLIGAAKPQVIDYRLSVITADRAPKLAVEIRLRGDADGETQLTFPTGLTLEPKITGARVQTLDATHRLLRHRANAKLTVRYQTLAPSSDPRGLLILGEKLFATPEGRHAESATFSWAEVPPGWRTVSTLEPGAPERRLTVADLQGSVLLAGPGVQVAQRQASGATIRAARVGTPGDAERLADLIAPAIIAERAFWHDPDAPFLIVSGDITGAPRTRTHAVIVATGALGDPALRADVARARLRDSWPLRMGNTPGPAAGLNDGLVELLAVRTLLQRDLMTPVAAVAELAEADAGKDPGRRGSILALKWDEDIRRKTGGKLDLNDVVRRMADHHARFAPGQGPDGLTGLISAAWVVAGLDLRPDIARYAETGQTVPLPEEMFDGCLQARVTLTPGFDAGFNVEASFAAKRLQGVRRRGPAWNSGLRDGMALERWTYAAGDKSQMIELTVRPAGKGNAKARTLAYWPYGDATVETRRLQLTPGMSKADIAACGRKLGGR